MNLSMHDDVVFCESVDAFLLAFVFLIVSPTHARADLSQNQARKVIQTMAGWSLPGSAVRVQSVKSSSVKAQRSVLRSKRCFACDCMKVTGS